MLAAVGLGWFESVEEACRELVKLDDIIDPSPDTDLYEDAYACYRGLYPALAPTFHSLP
jgi:xylulokinase